tara:strand:+ start:225 stop:413 length:189 start_codon:yes stop_codon:yes gene_type:complete
MNHINNNPLHKRREEKEQLESFLRAIEHFKRPSKGIIVKVAKRLEIPPILLKREIEKLDCFL